MSIRVEKFFPSLLLFFLALVNLRQIADGFVFIKGYSASFIQIPSVIKRKDTKPAFTLKDILDVLDLIPDILPPVCALFEVSVPPFKHFQPDFPKLAGAVGI